MHVTRTVPHMLLGAFLLVVGASGAFAQTPQTLLPGSSIPQFVDPLPTLTGSAVGGDTMESVLSPSSSSASPTTLYMKEFLVKVLPSTTPFAAGTVYNGTSVFGYRTNSATAMADTYIGPVLVPSRGTPTAVKYVNNLGTTAGTNVGVWKYSVDQTLHWANPADADMTTLTPYSGPIPAVAHLHGGEVPAAIDGGPDAWFLSQSSINYAMHGQGYYTYGYNAGTIAANASNNYSTYIYPNKQEAGPLWFHDHLLGGTRINVYAGLAGAYLLTDPNSVLPQGMTATGLDYDPANAGTNTSLTIPLVLQDRMFDTTGQLYFPDLGINPTIHPFWIPEFVGDTIVVNGRSWPYLQVDPKRYRFLMINGSNARFYELSLGKGIPMYVIGTDGGYLDSAVKVDKLVIAPGERYQIMIDFGKYAGKTLLMTNTGRTPFPKGTPPQGATLGRIIQFRVNAAVQGFVDNSYNPAQTPAIRSTNPNQTIQRLVDPATGTLNPALTVAKNRQLTLNEVIGAGGPLEILVNNTKWNGKRPTGATSSVDIPGFSADGIGNNLSELPAEGTTEVWEIINLTADAHPIHLHLVQFQILNRQNFNVSNYTKAYDALFPAAYDFVTGTTTPGGVYVPAYGPPMAYPSPGTNSPITGAPIIGGNPDVTPYLQGHSVPPDANEAGWKDTAVMYPGQVTRIAVRFSPTDTAPGTTAYYPFVPNPPNPNAAAGTFSNYNFVWHCHIVDHEDNEMMRPYQVDSTGVTTGRTYVQPTDY
jgi:spore coat protein A